MTPPVSLLLYKEQQTRPCSSDFWPVPACSERVRRVVQAHDHGDAPAPADSPDAVGDGVGLGRRVVAAALFGQGTQSYASRRRLGCCCCCWYPVPSRRFSRCGREEGLGGGRARAGGNQPGDEVSQEGDFGRETGGERNGGGCQHLCVGTTTTTTTSEHKRAYVRSPWFDSR